MKTNTKLLMNALGWQGGTIHQVAKETGLNQMQILDLTGIKLETVEDLESYNNGSNWAMSGQPGRSKVIPKEAKGNKFFWLAVVDYYAK